MPNKAPATTDNKQSQQRVMKSAADAVKFFQQAWEYAQQNHHERWKRNWKLYNNKRALVGYKGISNTFVPLPFSTVETITAALCAGRPSIDFVPMDMYQYIATYYATKKKPDLKALNALYDYYWECDNWDLKGIKTVRTGLIYGTACEWVYWDGDKPRIINLNPRDAIIDPSLTDPMQLVTNPNDFKSGRRYLTTLEALKAEQVVDPETGELKPRFKNLDKVVTGTLSGDQTDKEMKELLIGSVNPTQGQLEVLEIWDGQRIRSIAQRKVTIEDRPNTLGMHCLVIHRFIADESIIYGKAVLDPIAHPVEHLNDTTNQRLDAVTDALNPQSTLDPAYAAWLPKMKNKPGTVYPFKPGSWEFITKPSVPAAAFQETQGMKNDIREAVAADQVVQGVTNSQQTTATEIKATLNQAGERFELYVRMLEREGLYQRTKIVYKMILTYVKDKQLIPVPSIDGPKFRQFNPQQFNETYEPQIRLAANIKNQKAQDSAQATQSYQVIIADPTNDLWQAKKILYPKMFDLSEEELDRIIGTEPPQPPPGLPAATGTDAPAMGGQGEAPSPLAAVLSAPAGPPEGPPGGLPQ